MKKLSKVLPALAEIAKMHGLKIHRGHDWKIIVKMYKQNGGM